MRAQRESTSGRWPSIPRANDVGAPPTEAEYDEFSTIAETKVKASGGSATGDTVTGDTVAGAAGSR
jgi:hypothetical protein